MSSLLIVGAGGHGRVVADAAQQSHSWATISFVDDKYPQIRKTANWDVIGTLKEFSVLMNVYKDVALGVGDNAIRMELYRTLISMGYNMPTIKHPNTSVSNHVEIGKGCVIFANTAINIGGNIGHACIINTGATIDHDCTLGNGVHISPGAHLGGDVEVGEGSWIGIGASIRNGVTIGKNVMVGAGAAVISDVGDNKTVVGVPAKAID